MQNDKNKPYNFKKIFSIVIPISGVIMIIYYSVYPPKLNKKDNSFIKGMMYGSLFQ